MLAAVFGGADAARAQTTAAVGIVAGYYRPFGHFDPASVYSTALPSEPSDLSGFALGGSAHLSFGRRFGLEAQMAVARGEIPVGGDAYARYGNPTSVGAAAGMGLAVPITRQLHVAANLTTLWYVFDVPMPPELQLNPGRLEHGAMRDALLHVGVRWGGM